MSSRESDCDLFAELCRNNSISSNENETAENPLQPTTFYQVSAKDGRNGDICREGRLLAQLCGEQLS